jgi:hypothetical protein
LEVWTREPNQLATTMTASRSSNQRAARAAEPAGFARVVSVLKG